MGGTRGRRRAIHCAGGGGRGRSLCTHVDKSGGSGELLQLRFLNRQLVLPVSMMSQWCVSRSSMAVVILASPHTCGQSGKARLGGVSRDLVSYRLLVRGNNKCPAELLKGR